MRIHNRDKLREISISPDILIAVWFANVVVKFLSQHILIVTAIALRIVQPEPVPAHGHDILAIRVDLCDAVTQTAH